MKHFLKKTASKSINGYTDEQLASAIKKNIVDCRLFTKSELNAVLKDPKEIVVRAILEKSFLKKKKWGQKVDIEGNLSKLLESFWDKLGQWMKEHGGNIEKTNAKNAPGRIAGHPSGLTAKSLYNDVFRDTGKYIHSPSFNAIKATSNCLRFVKHFEQNIEKNMCHLM